MNRITLVLLGVLLISVAAAADGAQPPSDYQHLKPLEWLIGDWVAEHTSPIDLGNIKQGDRVVSHVSRRWVFSRSAFGSDTTLEANGRKTALGHEVYYWDPVAGKVLLWSRGFHGTGTGTFTIVGERTVLTWVVAGKEGKFAGTVTFEKLDDNSYTSQLSGVTLNGDKLADFPKITYRRKTGVPAGELWKAWNDFPPGLSIGTGTVVLGVHGSGFAKGDQFTYRLVWGPSLEGAVRSAQGEFRVAGKDHVAKVHGLAYWDPSARGVRMIACWSDGMVEELLINGRRGEAFLGHYTAKSPDHPAESGAIIVEGSDPETTVLKFLDGPHKGKQLSSWKRQAASD